MILHVCVLFPLLTPVLTKERQTPLFMRSSHIAFMHPSLSRSPSSFLTFLPADAPIQNSSAFLRPKCFPESKSIGKGYVAKYFTCCPAIFRNIAIRLTPQHMGLTFLALHTE